MSENKTQYTIAVIPGDGIGKEVTPWAQQALEKAAGDAAQFTYVDFDLGAERYLRDGEILPDEDLERIKGTDAILLGAVGDPRVKAGVLERGLLLKLRFALDQYVNLRPSKLYKGVTSPLAEPGEIDFVVVREQQTAENGDIVAALLDDEATVKTFRNENGHIWLIPHNPNYAPIDGTHAQIMGKVVTVLRKM